MRRLLLVLGLSICLWHCHGRPKPTPPRRIVNTLIPFEESWVNWDSAPMRGVLADNRRWVFLQNQSLATVSAYSLGCFDSFGNPGSGGTVTYEITLTPHRGQLYDTALLDKVDTMGLRQELCDDQEKLGIVSVELIGGHIWQAAEQAKDGRQEIQRTQDAEGQSPK